MPQLIIPNAMQVSLHFTVSGQETVNVLGFTKDDPAITASMAADIVHNAWTATGGPHKLLTPQVVLNKVKATDISSADGEIFERGVSVPGGATGTVGNLAVSAVVRVGSGTRSRSGKGRVYFGPIGSQDIATDGRSYPLQAQTNVRTAFLAFQTATNNGNLTWSVLSRKLLVATEITSVSVAPIIGIQRRRLR